MKKQNKKTVKVSSKKKSLDLRTSRLLLFFIPIAILGIVLSVYIGFLIGQENPKTQFNVSPTNLPTRIITPSPTSTPTVVPANTVKPKPSKVDLHVDVIDYSQGHPGGLITDVTVQLYDMEGTLLQEARPSTYVQDGPVGSGGDAVFHVLPSTYKVAASTESTYGTCIVIVRNTTEYNSCAIYMEKKK